MRKKQCQASCTRKRMTKKTKMSKARTAYAPVMEGNCQYLDFVNSLFIFIDNYLQFVNAAIKNNYVDNTLFNRLNLI